MRVIDFHTHVFPDALAENAISMLEQQGGVRAWYDGKASGLVASMDRAGIDVSVVLPVATKLSQVRSINDWVSSLASDRILPFGAMHPDCEDPDAEMARMLSLGLRGLKMHPEYQSFELEEPRMEPVFAAALKHGMTVLLHAGGDIAFETTRGTPPVLARVLDRWPGLTVVLAHMGGYQQWPDVPEHLVGKDVWLDTAYSLGHLPDEEFLAIARAHGVRRVLFGSDGPWTDSAAELEHMRRIGFDEGELEAILGGNAQRLLGLTSS